MQLEDFEIRKRPNPRSARPASVYEVYYLGELEAVRTYHDDAKLYIERAVERSKRNLRNCMACGDCFLSEGVGNRLCDSCRVKTTASYELQMEMPL